MSEENISQEFKTEKCRWSKKLFSWRNKSKWIDK